jgi:maltooligosyltrehalose trehalohydrolase
VDRERVPGYRFVAFLQDHDQVGNRAAGERLTELTRPGMAAVGAVLLLTSPFTPLLWMGEEWAASTRWPFFTDHSDPELAAATSRGRLEEFSRHGWDPVTMTDPQDPAAFERSKLDWDEVERPGHAEMLSLYRSLLALRAALPELADTRLDRVEVSVDEAAALITVRRGRVVVAANVGDGEVYVMLGHSELLVATDPGCRLARGIAVLPARSALVARATAADGAEAR